MKITSALYLLFYGYISLLLLEEITDAAEYMPLEEDIPIKCVQRMLGEVVKQQKEHQKNYAILLEQQQQQQQLQQLQQQQQNGIIFAYYIKNNSMLD